MSVFLPRNSIVRHLPALYYLKKRKQRRNGLEEEEELLGLDLFHNNGYPAYDRITGNFLPHSKYPIPTSQTQKWPPVYAPQQWHIPIYLPDSFIPHL